MATFTYDVKHRYRKGTLKPDPIGRKINIDSADLALAKKTGLTVSLITSLLSTTVFAIIVPCVITRRSVQKG